MSRDIISLSEYRRRKAMGIDEKIRELAEYYDSEIDQLHEVIGELKERCSSLEGKVCQNARDIKQREK